jgi:hypothetical protein
MTRTATTSCRTAHSGCSSNSSTPLGLAPGGGRPARNACRRSVDEFRSAAIDDEGNLLLEMPTGSPSSATAICPPAPLPAPAEWRGRRRRERPRSHRAAGDRRDETDACLARLSRAVALAAPIRSTRTLWFHRSPQSTIPEEPFEPAPTRPRRPADQRSTRKVHGRPGHPQPGRICSSPRPIAAACWPKHSPAAPPGRCWCRRRSLPSDRSAPLRDARR